MLKILLIEDRPGEAELVREMLGADERASFDVVHVPRLSEGLERLSSADIDAILLDLQLPDSRGLETFERTATRAPDVPILVLSSLDDRSLAVKAVSESAQDYLVKGRVDAERLARAIRHAVERKKIEEALRQRTAELAERNRDLDTFADTVAHNLKTPLSLMFGFASYLQENLEESSLQEIRALLEQIIHGCCKMQNIIEGLLILTSVRRSDVERRRLDMEMIVREALKRLDPMIEEAEAEITVPETWPAAEGCAPWIEEVWVNYLSNALKYGGDPPKITLGADAPSDGMVKFWIRDEGEGIPPEEQASLFQPSESTARGHQNGYGLGLSIVRRIVSRLGGQVGVESRPGRGSTFYWPSPN